MTGYLLQHSPQDGRGFEAFFTACLEGLHSDSQAWVFMRGDGIYQGLRDQRLDEPGYSVPVAGGWNALTARGVQVYVNTRCARLRGLAKPEYFLPEAKFVALDQLVRLSLSASRVIVL